MLVPYFPFFESELVQLINDVALSDFVTESRPTAGLQLTGGNMGSVADRLADFITACRKLRDYLYAEVLMEPVPPEEKVGASCSLLPSTAASARDP